MKLSTKWTMLAMAGLVSGGVAGAAQKGKPKPASKEDAPQNEESATAMKQDSSKTDSTGKAPSDTGSARNPKAGKASCKGHSSCKGMGGCGT